MKIKDKLFLGFLAGIAFLSGWAGLWALTALFGGIVLAILGGQFFFNQQKVGKIISKGKTGTFQNKYDQVNIKKYSFQFLSIGMLIATATTLLAFNWSTSPPEAMIITGGTTLGPEEIEPPVTFHKPPPPPPPIVAPPEIEVVKDTEIIEEEVPTNLFTDEVGENQVVKEVFSDLTDLVNAALKTDVEIEPELVTETPIFVVVDKMPSFPGGEQKMLEYIYGRINYPPIAKENGIEGRCVISFVVMEDGNIQDIAIERDIGGGCAEEVVRVIESMPTWNAGEQNFKKVRVRFNLPIKFTLE